MVSVSHAKLNIVEIVLNHQIFVKSVTKILYLLKLNVFVKKDIPYMKENVPLVRFLIVCIAQHQLIWSVDPVPVHLFWMKKRMNVCVLLVLVLIYSIIVRIAKLRIVSIALYPINTNAINVLNLLFWAATEIHVSALMDKVPVKMDVRLV